MGTTVSTSTIEPRLATATPSSAATSPKTREQRHQNKENPSAASSSPRRGEVSHDGNAFKGEVSREGEDIYVSLTYHALDAGKQMARVKSGKAGAVVVFAGCTRDSFANKPVTHLAYSTYAPLALRTLHSIAESMKSAHDLTSIAITHRLGRVDIGEESILIALASPHRQAAWRAGEECLEEVKRRVEIWKEEWFAEGGVWRSNRDGAEGIPVGGEVREAEEGAGIRESMAGRRGLAAGSSSSTQQQPERRVTVERMNSAASQSQSHSRRRSSKALPRRTSTVQSIGEEARASVKRRGTGEFTEGGFEL